MLQSTPLARNRFFGRAEYLQLQTAPPPSVTNFNQFFHAHTLEINLFIDMCIRVRASIAGTHMVLILQFGRLDLVELLGESRHGKNICRRGSRQEKAICARDSTVGSLYELAVRRGF